MMSYRSDRILSLTAADLNDKTKKGLRNLFTRVLNDGMHGICSSPYQKGQKPGDQLSEKQVRRRLNMIKPHTKWIRSFSCTAGNEMIPRIAKELGFKTLVGAWLGDNHDENNKEISSLKALANAGYVDMAAVGNEVLYRGDLTEQELLRHIYEVKSHVDIPIGYVDAYYEFINRPGITEACDVVLANCYPYWEGCSIDYALIYLKDMYNQVVKAANGKKVIISETGWPTEGQGLNSAVPSADNAMKYFINAQRWSKEDQIDMFYFSSFDESRTVSSDGDVGTFWGIWDKNETPKFYTKPLFSKILKSAMFS